MGGFRNIIEKAESLPGGKYADPIKAFGGVDLLGDLSGKPQEEAAKKAAAGQYAATMAAIEEQRRASEQQRADLQPFRQLATPESMGLWSQMAMTPADYSYNPATDQLLQDAANVASNKVLSIQAAQGKAGSGGTQLAINQALAPIYMQRQGQIFDQAFNARSQRFGELGNIIGTSQNAAAGLGGISQTGASNIANLRTQGANALAAGGIAQANAQAQGTQNLMGLAAMAASFFSDERLKENIMLVGKDKDGNNVYEWEYKAEEKPRYLGYMAQEVMKKDPQNVLLDQSGYLKVGPRYAPMRIN